MKYRRLGKTNINVSVVGVGTWQFGVAGMYKVTKFPHGTFSWADGVSTDASNGKQFYAGLMGWTIDDQPIGDGMVYTMFKSDGETVAGFGQIQPELEAQGVPSHWNSYVTVDDVDAIAGKVKELGGTIIAEPFDVFDSGRMAFAQDPTGARIAFWQAKNHIGAGLVNTPGAMGWNELATNDVERAKSFYSQLLGWEIQKDEDRDYYFILNNGRMNGGIRPFTPEEVNAPPNWMVYFSVADIDAAAEKVKSLGGNLIVPMIEAEGVGRFSIIADPQGAVSTIIQLDQPQPWEN